MNGNRKRARLILLGVIFSLHCALILGPLGFNALMQERSRKKPIAFRVQLGGFEPSHAPEVGIPERKRPAPAPANPAPPKPAPPKKTAAKKPVPKKTVKKTTPPKKQPKKTVKKTTPPKKTVTPKRVTAKKTPAKKTQLRKKPETPEVFHDNRWDNFDPNKTPAASGGKNFNRNVPIGTRDRGQKIGKADHRTPAGGATADEEKYAHDLVNFIREKWNRPPGILVDDNAAVTIELTIAADGRVTGKRIVKSSPNPAVNRSVQDLLKNLSLVPRPPGGSTTLSYSLVSE